MPSHDTRVDEYIAKAQPFARPIMEHLRELVHQAVPDVQETIKWGMPAFEYKGPLCSMASFKAYIHFMFWKGALLRDRSKHLSQTDSGAKDPMTGTRRGGRYWRLILLSIRASLLSNVSGRELYWISVAW